MLPYNSNLHQVYLLLDQRAVPAAETPKCYPKTIPVLGSSDSLIVPYKMKQDEIIGSRIRLKSQFMLLPVAESALLC